MIKIDDREVTQHPDIPVELGIPTIVERMLAGDYAFLDSQGNAEGIERCEIGNFVQKLQSGELEEQLYKMERLYRKVILLVEGVYDDFNSLLAVHKQSERGYYRTRIYPTTRYDRIVGALVGISELGVEVVHTANIDSTMTMIRTIYKQRTRPMEDRTLFKRIRVLKMPVKLSANPAVPRLMALGSRMPEKVAIALVYKYSTIWNVLHTPDKELLAIDGMGKGLLQKLKQNIGKESL